MHSDDSTRSLYHQFASAVCGFSEIGMVFMSMACELKRDEKGNRLLPRDVEVHINLEFGPRGMELVFFTPRYSSMEIAVKTVITGGRLTPPEGEIVRRLELQVARFRQLARKEIERLNLK